VLLFPTCRHVQYLGYFLFGLSRIKVSSSIVNFLEQCLPVYAALACACITALESSTTAIFCLFVKFVSTDAMAYLWFFNFLGLGASLLFSFVCVESPKWLLMQGRAREAVDNLNYIASVNKDIRAIFSSRHRLQVFDPTEVKLVLNEEEAAKFQKPDMEASLSSMMSSDCHGPPRQKTASKMKASA